MANARTHLVCPRPSSPPDFGGDGPEDPVSLARYRPIRCVLERSGITLEQQHQLLLDHNRRVVKERRDYHFLQRLYNFIAESTDRRRGRVIGAFLDQQEEERGRLQKEHESRMYNIIEHHQLKVPALMDIRTPSSSLWLFSKLAEQIIEQRGVEEKRMVALELERDEAVGRDKEALKELRRLQAVVGLGSGETGGGRRRAARWRDKENVTRITKFTRTKTGRRR
ncbi:hypothetical protein KVT40_003875 [Elsinoe batatas]|uniref:Uncharacterized protein n=1 Tax=Elsinoe batatas TaxID=2601811 RepID=A0A8K0L2U5_9PEZI|nr:hypothetical protein KVT40_003875 [Elsinoe batatas]